MGFRRFSVIEQEKSLECFFSGLLAMITNDFHLNGVMV